MSVKDKKDTTQAAKPEPMMTLFFVAKEEDPNPGGGWSQGFAVTEYSVPKGKFLELAKKIDKSEPEIFNYFLNDLTKRVRTLLGI